MIIKSAPVYACPREKSTPPQSGSPFFVGQTPSSAPDPLVRLLGKGETAAEKDLGVDRRKWTSWSRLPKRSELYDLLISLLKIAAETNRAVVQINLRRTFAIGHLIHVLADSVLLQPALYPLVPAHREDHHAIASF